MKQCYDSRMRRGFALCAMLVSCTGKTSAPQATPAPSDSTSSTPPAFEVSAKLRVNTDPDRASVKEDGYEVCNSTPCEITYKGAVDADPAKSTVVGVVWCFPVKTRPLSVKISSGTP